MSLLRALQSQGMLTDLPRHAPEGTVRLVSQTPTDDTTPLYSDPDIPPASHYGTTSSSSRSTLSTVFRRDNLIVGTRVIIAQEADLRGEISVGSGTVIHPKATVLALQGPISIGSDCIIEETAVIVNRRSTVLKIGDRNLFEVGCRIEAAGVGSANVFEVRSKVAQNVKIGSYSVVGAGCTVLPKPIRDDQLARIFDDDEILDEQAAIATEGSQKDRPTDGDWASGQEQVFEELPDQTVVYGADSKRRLWSGEGAQQQAALHAKHLDYLRDTIPRVHKLKIIQGVRTTAAAPASAATASSA